MKSFLKPIILASALLTAPLGCAQAQVLFGVVNGAASGRSCTDDTASTNFLARTSGLSNTEKDAYCNLIKTLESNSIITGNLSGAAGCGTIPDAIYIPATNNTTTAALNLCGTGFSLTTHGSPTFTADVGYTGDGSAAYLDPGFGPSTAGINLSLNSATIAVGIQNTNSTAGTVALGADNGGSSFMYFVPIQTGGTTAVYDVNDATFPTFTNSNSKGAWVITRTAASGAGATSVYQNAATTAASTTATSVTTAAVDFAILALNNNGTVQNFTNSQISYVFIGAGLTSTQAFNLNAAFNTFLTSNGGHNVY